MGERNSTATRVAPVFQILQRRPDPWLDRLLRLPSGGHPRPLSWAGLSLDIDELRFGDKEKPLPPPASLLDWLAENAVDVTRKGLAATSGDTKTMRQKLLARDPATIATAKSLLASNRNDKQWFVLEGPSYPDVFIMTPDLVVVIEGKRIELGPTTSTTWMAVRHQMLRHMDCALEAANDRAVLGFFVVQSSNDGEVPARWKQAAAETISSSVIAGSLPHRTSANQELISKGFLGVTTWEAICREFGIDPRMLPDTT